MLYSANMKLSTYLKEKGESASDFARRGSPVLSRSTVSRLLSGTRRPSFVLAQQIRRMTAGKVDFSDWGVRRKAKGPFVEDYPPHPST